MRSQAIEPAGLRKQLPPGAAAGDGDVARRARAWTVAGALCAALAASSCGSGAQHLQSHVAADAPGAGVVFTYPTAGQWDVPVGARVLLTFSAPLSAMNVDTACATSAGQVTGVFCVEGPEGFVQGDVKIVGSTLVFAPPGRGLAAGTTYKVWARPALLPGATNLPQDVPLLTFRTRSTRIRAGEAATVLTVNGEPLDAAGATSTPLLDVAPVRLLFSEPLDPTSLTSASVRLVHAADRAAVEGEVVAHGIHLTFQPSLPLTAGEAYQLELTGAVRDAGGEALAPVAFAFTPRRATGPGRDLYPLSLDVAPVFGDVASQPTSRLGAIPVNSNVLAAQLVGTNTMGVTAGGLDTLAGDPEAMGSTGHAVNPLPMLIRRGQRLDLTSMSIRFGGEIVSGFQTGTLHFTMLTDALGYMRRNPYRPEAQEPDDAQAPTFVDFTMDAVMTGEDETGNVLSTQTIMGVRVLGLSGLDDNELAIDQVGAIDFDLMGVDTAPVALAMRLRTTELRAPTPDLGAPVLVSSSPGDKALDVPPADPVELNFSGPLHPGRIRDGVEVTLTSTQAGSPVPTSVRLEGATLVIVPSRRLDEGTSYTLGYAGLRSLTGADVAGGALTFTTAVTTATKATPPRLTALTPGAPCALVGASAAAGGRCAGGKDTDTPYQPFTLPANRDVRAIFDQPIAPATLTLGSTCGEGSVRVERLDASGQCSAVVPGTLVKRDRELRFVPSAPWTPGAPYRLTLVAGANATCDAGEICSRSGLPLDTDPLVPGKIAAGGPDVVVSFTGAPATPDTYQPQESEPFADQDGNGALDASEHPSEGNRVAMEITGRGGIVTAASLDGPDCLPLAGQQACSYLHATLPVSIGAVLPVCPIDARGGPSTAPTPCLEVRVFPSLILGTSISMSSTALGLIPMANVPTGVHVMRLRELGGPVHGYIMNEKDVATPQFVINQELYLDQPQLEIPLASHDVKSKPISATMKGPVTFRPDGRMKVELTNLEAVAIKVNITGLGLPGNIDLRIPKGEMRVTLVGPPLR